MEKKQICTVLKLKDDKKYKLIIPQEVENKIRYICNKVWDVEWSGTLFYTYDGSMENDTLLLTAKDIFVMDIGTSTYTEFNMSPSVISYMTEHSELLDCQCGLVHSHNQMATFLSGTDLDTLKTEGADRNHFLSLIVNNRGNYTAAFTRNVKGVQTITEQSSYRSFNDVVIDNSNTSRVDVNCIEYYMLDVIKVCNGEFSNLDTQLEEIHKNKKSFTQVKQPFMNNTYNSYNYNYNTDNKPKSNPKYIQGTLFDEKENMLEKETSEISFTEGTIKTLGMQLLTGCITISDKNNLNIEKWVASMPSTYEKRFGTGDKGFNLYCNWISMFVEFIVTNADNDNKLDEALVWSALAIDLITYLSEFESNDYIKEIINELETYIQ